MGYPYLGCLTRWRGKSNILTNFIIGGVDYHRMTKTALDKWLTGLSNMAQLYHPPILQG